MTSPTIPAPPIPTTVLGLSSPLPYRPVDAADQPTSVVGPWSPLPRHADATDARTAITLGPSSPLGERTWTDVVVDLARRPKRPSCTPAFYLGRSAETWRRALDPTYRPVAA